jgi:hypothetical protein
MAFTSSAGASRSAFNGWQQVTKNPMKFRPLHDRVVIRRLNAEEKTGGGIIIPDTAQEKPMEGGVVAMGPGSSQRASLTEMCLQAWHTPGHNRHRRVSQ